MSADRRLLPGSATLPRARRRRGTALLTAAAAVGALALSACGSGGTSGGSGGSGFVSRAGGIDTVRPADRTARPKLAGTTLDGRKLDTADYRGDVVVLNVWGSWCPPCRLEAHNFVKVAEDTEARGVRFVGINTRDTSKGPAQQFEKSFKVPYPSLYDPMGKLMLRFPKGTLNPQSIPSTVVLDRQGRVAARSLKPMSESDLRRMLDPLIAERR